jgi:mono/diheme cytochrome c family protein
MTRRALLACTALVAAFAAAADGGQAQRGAAVFTRYCALCHGANGDGKGIAAKAYKPPPANLVTSAYPDDYKETIIRLGGQAVGRSQFMPPWGKELSDEQIRDLVAYLGRIRVKS